MDSLTAANVEGMVDESLDACIAVFCPDMLDYLPDFMAMAGQYMAAGVLLAFLLWAIGFAVRTVYGWIDEWSRG